MSKKVKVFLIVSVCITMTIGIIIAGMFAYIILFDHQGPEFQKAKGSFVQAPIVSIQPENIIQITWATQKQYEQNEVLLKKDGERYPNYGVGANTTYDSVAHNYIHQAKFHLGPGNEDAIVDFEVGQYVFQVHSGSVDGEGIISEIMPVNL